MTRLARGAGRARPEMPQQTWTLHCGDAFEVLQQMPKESVDCIVTSPPYYGQRRYSDDRREVGRDQSLEQYVTSLVAIFSIAWGCLKRSGCVWINLGDSYCNAKGQAGGRDPKNPARRHGLRSVDRPMPGFKPKDLLLVPCRVAMALQEWGWFLRSDTIWHKPNAMPGSQLDRPTTAHEYCFLLSRARRYYFDSESIREPLSASMLEQLRHGYTGRARKDYQGAGVQDPSDVKRRILAGRRDKQRGHSRRHAGFNARWDAMSKSEQMATGSLPRSVWTIPTNSTDTGAWDHFAMMPKALARKLVVSACPAGGLVLDIFCGMATTGVVALEEGRSFVGIELNPKYHAAARERLASVVPLLAAEVSA